MPRPVLAALLLSLLLAGCSGGEEAAPAPSPTSSKPPPTRTLDDLEAALPTRDQVPDGGEQMQACPGDKGCAQGTASLMLELAPSLGPEEVERRYDVMILPEYVSVTAVAHDDAAAAAELLATARTDEEAFDGRFSTKGKDVSETAYSFGERGTGTLEDAAVEGWAGHLGRRVQVLTSPAGDADSPPLDHAVLHVARGNVTLEVAVSSLDDGERDAGELARRLVADYVERLGQE